MIVDTTTYTVEQLVNQVLVQSNCTSATAVNSRTGTYYSSSEPNGIGYFKKNPNSDFPFVKGVVLTTGNVNKVPGPNPFITNSDGSLNWLGDQDLKDVLLSQSNLTMNPINASYIEFDFVPRSSDFDFRFIFASEEYGPSQCASKDAFAFLLKDVTPNFTTSYTNLAIIDPATYPGTPPNTPISVSTIRDGLSGCPEVNVGAFQGRNQFNVSTGAISFDGQTKPLSAKASGLNINHTYHIKIVIADGNNNSGYDSALFLEGNSFSFGTNLLGPDKVVTNNSATCFGYPFPSLVANTTNVASNTTYAWYYGQPTLSPPTYGTLIPSETGTTLNLEGNSNIPASALVPGNNFFSLVYTQPTCGATVNTIRVEVVPEIVVNGIATKNICSIAGATSYNVDLTSQNSYIQNLVPNSNVMYFDTAQHANDVTNQTNGLLTLTPTISVSPTDTTFQVFARITNTTTHCFTVKPINFNIVAPAVASQPQNISKCARNATDVPLQGVFTMTGTATSPGSQALGSQSPSVYGVNFYYSQSDALSASSTPISLMPVGGMPGVNVLTQGWPGSVDQATVWVAVYNLDDPTCRDIKSFTLTVLSLPFVENVVSPRVVCSKYALPTLQANGSVYKTGLAGTGTTLNAGDFVPITPPTPPNTNYIQTLYIYNIDPITSCWNQKSFIVQLLDPINDPTWPQDATGCNSYTLPALPIWGKYYKFSGGPNTSGNAPLTGAALTINIDQANPLPVQTTEVWVYYQGTDPLCYKEKKITISLLNYTPVATLPSLQDCTSVTLSAPPVGSQYYNADHLGTGGGSIVAPGSYNNSQQIYLYNEVINGTIVCKSQSTFNITIGGIVNPLSTLTNTTFCTDFLLTAPTTANSGYYNGPHGSGPTPTSILLNGQPDLTINATTPNQQFTYYYYVQGQTCTNDLPVTITIQKTPLPSDITNVLFDQVKCDSYTLPSINTGTTAVFGAVNHTGNFYLSPLGASAPLTSVNNPNPTLTVTTPPTTVYQVYFFDGDSSCYVQKQFQITVNQTANPNSIVGLDLNGIAPIQLPVCNMAFVAQSLPVDGSMGNFYEFSHASNPTSNPIINPNYTNTGTYNYYYYLQGPGNNNNCYTEVPTSVTVTNTIVSPIADKYACEATGYNLPPIVTPTGAVPAKYYKFPGGLSTPNQQELLVNHLINTLGDTTVYVRSESCSVDGHNCCFDEKSFVVHILATPVAAPILPSTICSGSPTAIPLTYSSTVKNYDWTVSAPSINGALAGSATNSTTSINQALFNTVNTVGLATYTITPKYTDSTQGVDCAGTPITALVNINPAPVIPNLTQTICNTGTFSFTPADATPTVATIVPLATTYTWTATSTSADVSGYSNQVTGLSLISQTLNNSSSSPQDVVYNVIPTSGAAGNCAGNTFTITITVNPTVTVTTAAATTICSDIATNISLTSNTAGTTYTWTLPTATTVTGGLEQTTSGLTSIAQTLINTDANAQTIDYLVQPSFTNNTVTCPGTPLTITVTVNPKPVVSFSADQTICSNSPSSAVILSNSTTSPNVTYSWTAAQPFGVSGVDTTGTSNIINPQTLVNNNDNPVTVSYIVTASTTGNAVCAGPSNTYNITINPSPKVNAVVVSAICTGDTPAAVTLSSPTTGATYAWTATAPSQLSGFTPAGIGSITSTAITNSSSTTNYDVTYSAIATTADGLCPGTPYTYNLTVNFRPVIDPATYATIKTCDSYPLAAPVGGIGTYWTAPGGSNGGGTSIPVGTVYDDINTPSYLVYVYAESGTTPNCFDTKQLNINVYNVSEPSDQTDCGSHTLPSLPVGNYFNATGGVGAITNNNITVTQDIYVYGTAPSTLNASGTCSDEYMFTYTIIYKPNYFAPIVSSITHCDTDGNNDGYFAVDLTALNNALLGPLQIEDTNVGGVFHVRYYATSTDADNPTPANELVSPYIVTTGVPVYVRIDNTSVPSVCKQVQAINFIINKLPEPMPVQYSPDPATTDNVICFTQDGVTVATTAQLNANMTSPSAYSYVWSGPAPSTTVVGNTGIKTGISVPGVYNVVVTETATGCVSLPVSTTIIQSQPAVVNFTASSAFTEFQSVGVVSTGNAGINQHFMYSLDGGPYQDSPIFEDLNYGAHTILVKDMNGCGTTTINPFIINYPKYFTPNKDTWQSNWNIIGLDKFQEAKVYIYDRYGKIIKQITAANNGWDGTYNNELSPATDYWFAIYYTENGETKEFKSHFSLLR